MVHLRPRLAPSFPIAALVATVLLTVATVGWTTYATYESTVHMGQVRERHERTLIAAGEIIHFNEVLTMSAQMAAATGEPAWEERYRAHDPLLAAAIERAKALAPHATEEEHIASTDAANRALVAMEERVFALAREGRLAEARAILQGEEYAAQKAIYAAGVSQLTTHAAAETRAAETAAQRNAAAGGLLAGTLGALALGATLLTYRRVREWRGALVEATDAREAAIRDLDAAHASTMRAEKLTLLGQLTAGVAHEVNNPLQYLMTNNTLAAKATRQAAEDARVPQDTRLSLERATKLIQANETGLEKIRRLVLSLRGLSRHSGGLPKATDLAPIAQDVLTIVRDKAGRSRVNLVDGVLPVPPVPAAADEIGQILLNLVLNAIEACPEGGTVSLETAVEPDAVVFRVADTGRGIPPEVLPKIFTPFVTTKPAGNGLGLSLSQRIAHDHGGTLTFATRPGVGTIFTLRLPRAQGAA